MGLFSGIKNYFNEEKRLSEDLSAIYSADDPRVMADILQAADERLKKHRLEPTQRLRAHDKTLFGTRLSNLRDAALGRALSIGTKELYLSDAYTLLRAMRNDLDHTISKITLDLMTSNAGHTIAASICIDDMNQKAKAFVAGWPDMPTHVRMATPSLVALGNPNDDRKVAVDSWLDMLENADLGFLNFASRSQIRDNFNSFRKQIDKAVTEIEQTALGHLRSRDGDSIDIITSIVVPEKGAPAAQAKAPAV